MLRILHLEDCKEDALLIEHAVCDGGIKAQFTLVRDETGFISALEQDQFDVVLADNAIKGFDGLTALKMVQKRRPDVHFFCLSGFSDPNHIQKSLAAGATDYISKDNLSHLVTVLRQEQEKMHGRHK